MAKSPSRPSRSEPGAVVVTKADPTQAHPTKAHPTQAHPPKTRPTKAEPPEAGPATDPTKAGPTGAGLKDFVLTAASPVRTPAPTPEPLAPGDIACVRVVEWREGRLREWQGIGDLRDELHRPGSTLWVDMTDPSPAEVGEIGRLLGLHSLVAEDILEGNQRAKIEVTDQLCHIVMFALEYKGEMLHSEIDFVLGERFLLTVHEATWEPRGTTHLREGMEPIMRRGSDHLLWALVDALVDSYFPFVDQMGDEIDLIEDEVVTHADSRVLARLFQLKKDLLIARRAAAPVREIFNQVTNRDLALIDRDEVIYFRDVYDHLIRLTDELDNYRELVSSALDVYLSTVNNNLSLIMKRLTGVTVIFAGIGAIAGIFGMSEAGAAFAGSEAVGFWLVAIGSVAFSLGVYAVFRRIGWI